MATMRLTDFQQLKPIENFDSKLDLSKYYYPKMIIITCFPIYMINLKA